VEGQPVRELTQLLQRLGCLPYASHDGIFGYVTQAAVRLFQEYVRTIAYPDQHRSGLPPCWPDGIVGPHTRQYLEQFAEASGYCRWGQRDEEPTADHRRWMEALAYLQRRYITSPCTVTTQLRGLEERGDTLLPEHWSFSPDRPQLIGIRYHRPVKRADGERRPPDDLFVLLLHGRTFYFWGSTDANPAGRAEAYLVEGQHRYRFNWHNISTGRRHRIYKAARPAGRGVLVLRDVHGHNALTPENRASGLDPRPNPTINLHWSGLGVSNWSAGCQVISGRSYLNDGAERVDCGVFTARNDRERGVRRWQGGPRLGMGAYTVLSDLLLCYTPQREPGQKPTFRYTLLEESRLAEVPGLNLSELHERLELLRG
jgi:hypothetical protein